MSRLIESPAEPAENEPIRLREVFPTEGFVIEWDRATVRIRVTDYNAFPLVLSWEEIFDMALGTQRLPTRRGLSGD